MGISSSVHKISPKISFHFVNVDDYDSILNDLIKENIATICNGIAGDADIEILKIEILRWFDGKDEGKVCGFIAEFLCHLYLNNLAFEQHFLFKNLEETRSMKKGFDGVYQFEENLFLYESKSTLPTTDGATHNANIGEAYRDLRDKLNGSKKDSQNNPLDPWSNAVHHASLLQINPDKTMIQNLNAFKNNFIKGHFEDIKNFNIIPSSTIYMGTSWKLIDCVVETAKLKRLVEKYSFKSIQVLCINKKSVDGFLNYLRS